MTKSIRFVLLLSACALALAFGGNALAAYNPSLLVAGTSHSTGSGGPIVIGVGQDQADDATGVLNIYAPLGYGVTLTQAPNTRIGDLEGIVLVRALANARVPIQGTVTARDPGAYTNPAQFPCGQGIRHEAVWVIQTTLAGNRSKSRSTSTGSRAAPRLSSPPRRCGSAWRRRTSPRHRVRLPALH